MSFLVSKEIPANDFIKELKKAGGTNLRSVSVIDVYDGKGIDESLKKHDVSTFLASNRNHVEDKQVDQFVENQINHAAKIFNAELRLIMAITKLELADHLHKNGVAKKDC